LYLVTGKFENSAVNSEEHKYIKLINVLHKGKRRRGEMTGRERILSVLRGDIPDRVPVGLFVQKEYLSWFFQIKK